MQHTRNLEDSFPGIESNPQVCGGKRALSAHAFLFGCWHKRGDWEQAKQICSDPIQLCAPKTLRTRGRMKEVIAKKLTRRSKPTRKPNGLHCQIHKRYYYKITGRTLDSHHRGTCGNGRVSF